MKIVVAEKTSPAAIALLKQESGWQVITAEQIKGDLAAQLADADALVVRSAVQVDPALLAHAKKLRVIGRAGVGVDNIDLDAATKAGIVVMNTPGGNAVAVAEHAFALMLSLARMVPRADSTTREGKWEKKSLQGTELRGKTLGIVGLGRIGMEVARRALAFEMRVLAHDPFVAASAIRDAKIELVPIEQIVAQSDYISLHVGLTPQTQNMVNADSIARMKPGVRIINCARGELVDNAALITALTSGKVAGAALDVFTEEPPKDPALLASPNLIATPHIAGSTNEAQEAVGVQIALQVREYLKRGVIQNAVNVPSVSDEEYAQMHPFITLSGKLGAFLAQLADATQNVEEIAITYSGRVTEWKHALIRNSAIAGVLNQSAAEKANLVSAATMAEERGIRIQELNDSENVDGMNAIRVTLSSGKVKRTARGTVLHGKSVRLLELDGIDVEVPLAGNLIYIRNQDVPGVIGHVGTVLGKHNVNIADFSLGRDAAGAQQAIAVVHVDGDVPAAALQELQKVAAVREVKPVRL